MALTLNGLCERIATAIVAASTTPLPWKRSVVHPVRLGEDTKSRGSCTFSVWSPQDSAPTPNERQRPSEGFISESAIEVRFVYRVRGDGVVTDVGSAYTAEDACRIAVMGISRADLPVLVYDGCERSFLDDDETQLHLLRFRARFHRTLQ